MKETEAAIKQLKCEKALGPDGVTNHMIKPLDLLPRKHSLSSSMNHGRMAQFLLCGKKPPSSQSIKGKDKEDPNSYHPICLLRCLGKLLERVINRRLISFSEEQKILSPTQTGYQKHRSTEDQLAIIAQEIETAFEEKKKVVSVFFDLTKAFDEVWREGLLLKILESGVSGRMYRWIWCFLHNRSARVKLDGHLSKSVKTQACKHEESHREESSHRHSFSCTSTTSRLCFPDMSPTPYIQMICVECIWMHHIFCLQNPGSCEQGRAVDKWLGSSDQWSVCHFSLMVSPHPKKKSP